MISVLGFFAVCCGELLPPPVPVLGLVAVLLLNTKVVLLVLLISPVGADVGLDNAGLLLVGSASAGLLRAAAVIWRRFEQESSANPWEAIEHNEIVSRTSRHCWTASKILR